MDLFGDLASVGIKNQVGEDIFKDEEVTKKVSEEEKKAEKILNEADFVFDKTMQCPVCGKNFKTKKVRVGKARFVGTDSDLRPIHEGVDTVKYDAIVCTHCGYASLERLFSNVTTMQMKEIKEKVSSGFTGLSQSEDFYTYEEALQRYKLTLYNCVVRKLKDSEKAYVCLKIAWIYRGMENQLPQSVQDDAKKKEFKMAEEAFILKAYEGFSKALLKESMPICGMDQNTLLFLMADLARQCKDYDNAVKYVYDIISSRGASAKVKDKARTLNERIKAEKDAQKS